MKRWFGHDKTQTIISLHVSFSAVGRGGAGVVRLCRPVGRGTGHADEISDTILQYLDDIPKGYKSNIEFDITDYEGYSPKAFMDAFKYLLECDRMRFRKEKHKKNVMIAGLLSAGLFFLLIMILTLAFTFINETVDEILTAVIEIASWVFIWEAIDLIFLSPTDTFKKGVVFFSKIESVSFSEGDCVNVISCGIEELHNELKGA